MRLRSPRGGVKKYQRPARQTAQAARARWGGFGGSPDPRGLLPAIGGVAVGHLLAALYELGPDAMASALKNDRLDLGFYYSDIPDAALESRFLGRLRSHVYASKGYLKEGVRLNIPRDILRHAFIAPGSFGADTTLARADGFPDRRYQRRIQYEAESLEAHRRFVLNGLCVGVLPDLVMKDELRRGEAEILGGPPIYREIYCFRREQRALPKAVEFFTAAIRAAIRKLA